MYTQIEQSYVENGRIELPLDYNPVDQNLSTFTYGTTGSNGVGNSGGNPVPDFFTLDTNELDAVVAQAGSIIKSYSIVNDVLILELKSKTEYPSIAGLKSFQLKFNFNNDYKMKVPVGTVMWKPQPSVYVGDDLARTATAGEVKTSATNEMTFTGGRQTPGTEEYRDGSISLRLNHLNRYYYESDFDPTYNPSSDPIANPNATSRIWIEVPTGSTVLNALFTTTWFPDGVDININSSGYDRYYKNVKNVKESWNMWQYSGYVWNVFNQTNFSLNVPDFPVGHEFFVRAGADYRKINGAAQEVSLSVRYVKSESAAWDLVLRPWHNTSAPESYKPVCGIEDDEVTSAAQALLAAAASYSSGDATKNIGTGSISGVTFDLYQASTSSAKVNFNTITFNAARDAVDPANVAAWASYRFEVWVTDAITHQTRLGSSSAFTPSTSATAAMAAYPIPMPNDMGVNEYISSVKAIPMGTDGTSEGEWPSRNNIGIGYTVKAWDNKTWPDGTTVPNTTTAVPMAWKLYYDNEEGTATTFQGNTARVYYSSLQPYAQAALLSNQAPAGVNTGSTVAYTLNGYNTANNALSTWNNPRIIVRVPDVMTLKNVNSSKTLTDVTSGNDYPAVSSLLGSSGGYKYYSFVAPGYNAPMVAGQTTVFTIPLEFEISSTAEPKDYEAPQIVVTTTSPTTFYGVFDLPMNGNLGASLATYGLESGDNYSIVASPASSTLRVLSSPQLDVASAVSSRATNGLYVESKLVPAEHGETTRMMLTIKNAGNVDFTNIRLYDILPYNLDPLGSSGGVDFDSLVITGASSPSIRYTTAAPATLPTYGEHGLEASGVGGTLDLQVSTFQDSWTSGSPGATASALFLDFGTQVLGAGQEITIELLFDIPATGDQTAYNQFRYSAVETGSSGAKINQNAIAQGFSTETIALIYHGDDSLPALYASGGALEGTSDLGNMPAASSASFTAAGQTLAVDAKVPTLTGYTFKGWSTTQGATTPDSAYDPGDSVSFSGASTINLYPVWELNKYAVSYEYTNTVAGAPAVPGTATYDFNELVTLATTPSTTPSAALTGYTFSGWSTTSAGVNVQSGSFNLPDNTVVFKGTWTLNTNSITYRFTGTVPSGAAGLLPGAENTVAYGTEKSVSTAISTVPNVALPGYTFNGWTATGASGITVNGQGKFNMPDNAVVFEGSWTVNESALTYVYAGDVPLNADTVPVARNVAQGTEVTVASAPTAVTGFTFGGWVPTTGLTSGDISNGKFTMPNNAVTFTGTWTRNAYTVSYEYTNTVAGAPALPSTQANVPFASTFNVAGAPTLNGYTFSGWSSSDVTITSGSFNMPAKNVVIKGTWTANTYDISYAGLEGATNPNATKTSYNTGASALTFADAGSRTGYTFAGWLITLDATANGANPTNLSVSSNDAKNATLNTGSYGHIIVTAKWTANKYNVSYNANGGLPAAAVTEQATYDTNYIFKAADTFTRAGYTFLYWTTAQDGSGTRYDAGQTLKYTTNEATTLYAQWDPNTGTAYKVEHYLVSAAGVASLDHTDNRTGTTDTTATAVARTYASHTFNASDSRNVPSGNIDGNGSRVLKLYYAQNIYTVNFVDWNGATLASRAVAHGENALAPANPGRVGYSFTGWDRGYSNITANTTVRATYAINVYTVSFVDWDGSVLSSQSVAYGGSASAPANPSRTGYTFSGWDRGFSNVASNITVTATYTALPVDTFTITFLGYNDTVLKTATVNRGESTTPPSEPTRTGYRFTGWDKPSSAWTNVTADATIRAMWNNESVTTTPGTTDPGAGDDTTGGGTAADDLAAAANEQGIPSIGVPLAAPAGFAAWALGNLVLALLGVVLALVFAILRQFRKNIHNEVNGGGNNIRSIGWVIATIAFAVAGAVAFIITQDITLPMVWFDGWSIVSLVFFVGVLVLGSIAIGRKHIHVEEDAAPETM